MRLFWNVAVDFVQQFTFAHAELNLAFWFIFQELCTYLYKQTIELLKFEYIDYEYVYLMSIWYVESCVSARTRPAYNAMFPRHILVGVVDWSTVSWKVVCSLWSA